MAYCYTGALGNLARTKTCFWLRIWEKPRGKQSMNVCTSCKWEIAIIWVLRMCCKRAGGEPDGPGTQNPGTELRVFKQAKASEPQQTMQHFPHSGRNSSSLKSLQKHALLYSIKWAPCFKVSEAAPLSRVTEDPITDLALGLPPVEGECQTVRDSCTREHCWRWLLECREGLSKEQRGEGTAPTEQCKASSRHWIPTNMDGFWEPQSATPAGPFA